MHYLCTGRYYSRDEQSRKKVNYGKRNFENYSRWNNSVDFCTSCCDISNEKQRTTKGKRTG